MEPGGVYLFNCDQNGRDLPKDNKQIYSNGSRKYKCGCPKHYFLILSNRDHNDTRHTDWSKMVETEETDRKRKARLACAVPLDIIDENTSKFVYAFEDMDFVENNWNPNSKKEKSKFEGKNNCALCHKVCRVSLNRIENKRSLFYVTPQSFKEIIEEINSYFSASRSELKKTLGKFNQ
mgnify:CR=1 FL=1